MNIDTELKTEYSRQKTRGTRVESLVCGLLSLVLGLLLTGCGRQQHRAVTGQILVPDVSKVQTMKLAEDVLARMHFTIEKADPERGYLKTRPLPGAQFFEFWRSDNVGAGSGLQANLHTIRRTVELDISQRGQELCIGCNVQVQRLSLPEREISSSATAYEMFSRSTPSLQKLRLHPEQQEGMAWIDLGEDEQLATEILERIEKRVKRES